MEGSALTQKTIDVFQTLREGFPMWGFACRRILMRTGADVDELDEVARDTAALQRRLQRAAGNRLDRQA